MFSDFWRSLQTSSAGLVSGIDTDSAAIDGLVNLPQYVLGTLAGGAALFGS